MSSFWRWCLPASTLFLLAGPAAAAVAIDSYSNVSIEGIYKSNDESPYAVVDSVFGYSGSSDFRRTGPWGVSGIDRGEYRSGPYRSDQAADLTTGVMRSSLLYSNAPGDTRENLLNTYAQMSDDISFHGSGSATFVMRLSGSFSGAANSLYGNAIDTSLDFYSASRGSDVLGRIHLANNNPGSGQARFTPGTTCTGLEGYYALGSVSCTVRSLDAAAIDIDLRVTLNQISDGEVISFRSSLNLQTYGINGGGTDFGHTARLGVVSLSPGLSFSSNSGGFLTQAAPVPEPGTWLMMLAGLGAVGLLAARSRS